MAEDMRSRPPYAVASVDNALRIATMLQVEKRLTVTEAAARLGVAPSTAHRLLRMLVYRDFATQDDDRSYRPGPVLELAPPAHSGAALLRHLALPHLRDLVAALDESCHLMVRTGESARFIASVECRRGARVGDRDGMVFPAHRTTGGLVLLAELDPEELAELYARERFADRPGEGPDLAVLRRELAQIRRQGFVVNDERSERGVVAIGCPVRRPDGTAVAGISVSVPSSRYEPARLPTYVTAVREAASQIREALGGGDGGEQ